MSSAPKSWAVEAKVIAGTAASAAAGIAVAVLNDVQAHHELLGTTPPWLQAAIFVVAPPLVTFLAGYEAKHTARPEDAPPVPPVPPASGTPGAPTSA